MSETDDINRDATEMMERLKAVTKAVLKACGREDGIGTQMEGTVANLISEYLLDENNRMLEGYTEP